MLCRVALATQIVDYTSELISLVPLFVLPVLRGTTLIIPPAERYFDPIVNDLINARGVC